MLTRTSSSPVRRVVALVVTAVFLPACTSWRAATAPPGDHLREEGPADVRVWHASSGERTELDGATVRGDSLVGADGDGRLEAVPLSDVRRMEVRETDGGKTTLLVLGVAGGALLAFGALYAVLVTDAVEDAIE